MSKRKPKDLLSITGFMLYSGQVVRHSKSPDFSMESGVRSPCTYGDLPRSKPSEPRCPQQLGFQHSRPKCQPAAALRSAVHPGEALRGRGLSCRYGLVSYLCGPADLEQVEPVGVPVVDDVGQFPPLLLPAPRHGGLCFWPSLPVSPVEWNFPVTLVHRRRKHRRRHQRFRCFTAEHLMWSVSIRSPNRATCCCLFAFCFAFPVRLRALPTLVCERAKLFNPFMSDKRDWWRCFN